MYEEKFWAIYLKHVRSILKDFDGAASAKPDRAEQECASLRRLARAVVLIRTAYCDSLLIAIIGTPYCNHQ
jgi:hypothetical protein